MNQRIDQTAKALDQNVQIFIANATLLQVIEIERQQKRVTL